MWGIFFCLFVSGCYIINFEREKKSPLPSLTFLFLTTLFDVFFLKKKKRRKKMKKTEV